MSREYVTGIKGYPSLLGLSTQDFETSIGIIVEDLIEKHFPRTGVFQSCDISIDYFSYICIGINIEVSSSESYQSGDNFREELISFIRIYVKSRMPLTISDIRVQLHCSEIKDPMFLEMQLGCKNIKEENNMRQIPEIKNLIHSGDYTHIIWEDGTKTSVKREENTPYDAYGAFAQAVVKKLYGSTEKAKFEHTLKQLPVKEQKKVLAEKKARKEKQERAEKKKIDRQLKREEEELREKEEQVKATRAKRKSLFKSSEV